MKIKRKKFLAFAMATTMMFGGCSSATTEQRPDENMILKLNGSTSLVNYGGVGKPWSNISFGTSLLFRNLFIANTITSEVECDLAESYHISDDGLTYTIVLKDDIVWTDGEPVDLEDVVFSIEGVLLIPVANTVFTTAFKGIEGAEAFLENPEIGISGLNVNGNELTIQLANPNYVFMQVLSQFAILPEHILGDSDMALLDENPFWENPVTNGIYKMGDHVSGEYLEYVYNEAYTEQMPYIHSVMLRADYEMDEVGYYDTSDISDILDYRAISNMTEHVVENLFYRYFVFNIEKGGAVDPVMGDIRIRQAITYAIDRATLVKDIYYNTGEVINTGVVAKYNEPLDVDFIYDPEKAKELLAEANYDFDRPFILLSYYSDEISLKFMDEIQKYLEAVGLTVEHVQKGNLYSEQYDDYDMGLKGLSAFSTADWYAEYLSGSMLHDYIFAGNAEFDDLIYKLYATTTLEDRVDILHDLQELEYDLLYKYPIFTMGHRAYIHDDVTIPDDVVFGNTKYKYDIDIQDWKVKIN